MNIPWEWSLFVTCLNAEYSSPEQTQNYLYFEEEGLGIFNVEYTTVRTHCCVTVLLSFTFFPSFPAFILPLALTPPHSIALVCCSYLDLDQSETVDIHALGLLWNKVLNAHLCNNPHFWNTCMITWKSPGLFSMSSYQ